MTTATRPVSAEVYLAAAVRRINRAFANCPEPRPAVNGPAWSALEDEIEAALDADDRERALAAIRAWEAHARRVLGLPPPSA